MKKKLFLHDRRRNGRYSKAPACDACGKPTNEAERYTDDEVCTNTDGPGFFLCHRKRCIAARDLPLEERRTLYTEQRAKNDAAARQRHPAKAAVVTLLVLLVTACATEPDDGADNIEHCVGACFDVTATNAYFPPVRPSGAAWDADGSLPEPVMQISVNGKLLGTTAPRSEAQFIHYPFVPPSTPEQYRANWYQVLSRMPIAVDDWIEMAVLDAQERYLITDCAFAVQAINLEPDQDVGCFKDIGMITVTFKRAQ